MRGWINRFRRDQRGATILEYAMLIALIGLSCVAVLQQLGEPQQATYKKVDDTIQKAAKPAFGDIK